MRGIQQSTSGGFAMSLAVEHVPLYGFRLRRNSLPLFVQCRGHWLYIVGSRFQCGVLRPIAIRCERGLGVFERRGAGGARDFDVGSSVLLEQHLRQVLKFIKVIRSSSLCELLTKNIVV